VTVRIAERYAKRMPQLVTRVDAALIDGIDELIAAGVIETRSDAVRLGLERLIDRHRRDEIGRQIVEAYQRMPQTDEELAGVDEAAVAMIMEEPW
jgi:Arc/MetJ-type ribon-helix-helix transcriptional regulator